MQNPRVRRPRKRERGEGRLRETQRGGQGKRRPGITRKQYFRVIRHLSRERRLFFFFIQSRSTTRESREFYGSERDGGGAGSGGRSRLINSNRAARLINSRGIYVNAEEDDRNANGIDYRLHELRAVSLSTLCLFNSRRSLIERFSVSFPLIIAPLR